MTTKLTRFLLMEGNAKEDIHFYEEVLDARRRWADSSEISRLCLQFKYKV